MTAFRDGVAEPVESLADLGRLRDDSHVVLWIKLRRDETDALQAVAEVFGLHALAVEDAAKGAQRTKLDEYGEHLFLVAYAIDRADPHERTADEEVAVFAGRRFVVAVHDRDVPALVEVRRRLEVSRERVAREQGAFILYTLLDAIVDGYEPPLEAIGERTEAIEDRLLQERDVEAVREAYALRRRLLHIRRHLIPLAEVSARVDRIDVDVLGHDLAAEMRDVRDHLARAATDADLHREVLSTAIEIQLAIIGTEQNDTTKVLTAWGAILIAPTLVTGIYGMNFDHMPELGWRFGYAYALGLIVLLMVGLYVNFRRLGWLRPSGPA